ncbi:hypothetical protein N7463_007661 [Penicillium fimorum]|uniref:Uncharacterized protein n=1 Tax=Penicillium fimorum TaxID=1882269 RepID=A0A9X0C7D2_9EURO|nr:hypothetical protein N7463_007661 [Penicillium fimorum]
MAINLELTNSLQAISIAYLEQVNWSTIIDTAVQFVFWESFHRRQNVQALDSQLWDFLKSRSNYRSWVKFTTLKSVRALADASEIVTRLFIQSIVTFYTPSISILSAEKGTGVFDDFTSTLGVPTETCVRSPLAYDPCLSATNSFAMRPRLVFEPHVGHTTASDIAHGPTSSADEIDPGISVLFSPMQRAL